MKKSLLTLLTAILIGSSFTSCIENTVPDEVVAIYDGQANVLAAQAALLAAEANKATTDAALAAAMTAYQAALTDAQNIANAYAQANNAILLAQAEADLQASIAQTAANIATQEAELAALIAQTASDAALAEAELAALIAANDVANAQAIADLEASIAANEVANAQAIAELEATLAENAMILAENEARLAVLAAETAAQIAALEAELDATLAQAIADAAAATQQLAIAQAQFDLQIKALQDAMVAANDAEFNRYLNLYQNAYNMLNNLQVQEVNQQTNIIAKVREMAVIVKTNEDLIASLNGQLAVAQSDKADLENSLAELEASIAAGTTVGDNEATRVAIEEEMAANSAAIAELDVVLTLENEERNAAIAALNELQPEIAALASLNTEHFLAVQGLDILNDNLDGNNTTIENTLDIIAAREAFIADFDGARAALVTAIADAIAAAAAADAAVPVAEATAADAAAAEAIAAAAELAAETLITTEQDALVALEAQLATVLIDLEAAADALRTAKANETDTAPLEAAIVAAEGDVGEAIVAYNAAKAAFEADPNGSSVVTPASAGADNIFGNRNDQAPATYRKIVGVNLDGEATLDAAQTTALQPGEVETLNTWDNFDATDLGKYYDVEADDTDAVEETNFELMGDAVGLLEVAKLALRDAEEALEVAEMANAAIPGIEQAFAEAAAVYENVEADIILKNADIAAAITAEAAAEAALVAAQGELSAANAAVVNAKAAVVAADAAVVAAEAALVAFDLPSNSVEQATKEIAQAQADIAQIEIFNAALALEITAQEELIAEILAKLDAGKTPEMVAAEELVSTTTMAMMATQAEMDALAATNNSLDNLSSAIMMVINGEIDAVQAQIDGLADEIMTADADIAAIEESIVTASSPSLTDAERDAINALQLARLEADLAEIQTEIAFYTQLTAKYKDIVDSLL